MFVFRFTSELLKYINKISNARGETLLEFNSKYVRV
jgi:hypothetical protein